MEARGVLVDQFLLKPINLAHSLARKAEEYEENGDLGKAIEYHGKAAAMMQDFLCSKEAELDSQVNLSLNLQVTYHKNREKFLISLDSYKKKEDQISFSKEQNAADLSCEEGFKKDSSANFSLLEEQIQTGSLTELRKISSKLFELVKIQQEQIIFLSQQLQMFNAENVVLRKACSE